MGQGQGSGRMIQLTVHNATDSAVPFSSFCDSFPDLLSLSNPDMSWGRNHLESPIPPGQTVTRAAPAGIYDLKAMLADKSTVEEKMRQDLTSDYTWEIRGQDLLTVGGGGLTLTVRNDLPVQVFRLHISLSSESSWGSDRLGLTTMSFNVEPGTYDLCAKDDDDDEINRHVRISITGPMTWIINQNNTPPFATPGASAAPASIARAPRPPPQEGIGEAFFTCPVCMESFAKSGRHAPFVCCERGHVLCGRCLERGPALGSCPMCRGGLLERPVADNRLADAIGHMEALRTVVNEIDLSSVKVGEEPLRSGPHATIHSAEWRGHGVAVRRLLADPLRGNAAFEQLAKRARHICGMSNRNVLQVHGVACSDSGEATVVEELFDPDRTLPSLLSQELSSEARNTLAAGVAIGLAYLHSHGVVHGALNPSNVAVEPNYRVRLSHYGMHEVYQAARAKPTPSNAPPYCAPEVSEPGQCPSFASDVYSLASIFCCVFSSGTSSDPSSVPSEHSLRELVERALSRDPSDRPNLTEILEAASKLTRCTSPTEVTGGKHTSDSCTVVEAAQELAKGLQPPAPHITGLTWSGVDSNRTRGVREEMMRNLRSEGCAFRRVFQEPVLQAMATVPRHLFIDSSRVPPGVEPERLAYTFRTPMPAHEGCNSSAPEIIGAQLSLVRVDPGANVLVIGAKSGYLQSLIAQMVGFHGHVTSVSWSEGALRTAKQRVEQYCPLKSIITFRQMESWPEDYDHLDRVLEGQQFDAIIGTGQVDDAPECLPALLPLQGQAVFPVVSTLVVWKKEGLQIPLCRRDISDWGVRFGHQSTQ